MFAKIYLKIRAFIRHQILHIDDRTQLEVAVANGLTIGKDCHVMGECIIDPGHCWLIEIGDRVVIGAGSVVSKSIPANSVAVGNPAHVIGSYDAYVAKRKNQMQTKPCYDYSYTINQITSEKKEQMIKEIKEKGGGFVQ